MTPAWATPLSAVGAWVALVLLEAAVLWISAASAGSPQGGVTLFLVGIVMFSTVAGSVGAFLRIRLPRNAIGTFLLLGPMLIVAGFLGFGIAVVRLHSVGPDDVLGGLAGAVASAILLPGIAVTFAGVAILFPDGRLLTRWWRNAVLVVVAMIAAGSLLSLVSLDTSGTLPVNPIAIPGLGPDAGTLAGRLTTVGFLAAMGLALASVIVRFRRASGVERQQLKWFAAAVAVNVVVLPASVLTDFGPADVIDLLSVVTATLIPLAIGIAILRYRLYEIDTIINRAIVYGSLTAILAGLMAAAVAVTKQLFEAILGTGTDLTLIVSTVVAVSAFEPIKKRVQAFVDRRMKPAEDPALRLVALEGEFRSFVGALDPDRTMRRVLAVAMATQRAVAGTVRWQLGASEVRVLTLPDPAGVPDAALAPSPADEDARDLAVSVRRGNDSATVTIRGGTRAEPARAALASLLQTVLDELPVKAAVDSR